MSSASTTFQASDKIQEKKGKVRGKKLRRKSGKGEYGGRGENWPKIVWIFGCFGDDVRGGTTLFVQGAVGVAPAGFEPMRCENARVGKGGSGVARKRRRGIDASTPGPRERSGFRR